MLIKIIVILLLIVIIGSLSSGLFFLVSDKGHSDRAVKALTWRIALSLVAFVLLMLGHWVGLIQPHGLYY